MKKLLSLLMVILFSESLMAQIPNAGFESWTSGTPDGWTTTNAPGLYTPVTQSTDAHSGSYAARGEVVDFVGSAMPPALYFLDGTAGFPVTQDYTSLTGWFKSSVSNNDVFQIIIAAFDSADNAIGGNSEEFSSTSTYQRFDVPIFTNGTPTASYQIFFSILDTSSAATYSIGSFFLVDDLELTSTTEISEEKDLEKMKVFPNPADDYLFYVPSAKMRGQVTAQLFDLQGKSVYTEQFESTTSPQARGIDLSDISSGFYVLRLVANGSSEVTKVSVR